MCSLVCRLCLSDSVELYNIYNAMFEGVQATEVILQIFQIDISQNDDLAVMCPTCKVTLGDFYKFYKIVKASHKTLSKRLKCNLENEHSYGNKSKTKSSNDDCLYDIPFVDVGRADCPKSVDTSTTEKVQRIVNEINVDKVDSDAQSIEISPQTDEIDVKLDPNTNKNVHTIDLSNLDPTKLVVQKISKNFKIINNAGARKVTRIILAKNIPPSLLQQQMVVQKLVSNIIKKQSTIEPPQTLPLPPAPSPSPPPTPLHTADDRIVDSSDDDEALSKTKRRLTKKKVGKRVKRFKKIDKKTPQQPFIKVEPESDEEIPLRRMSVKKEDGRKVIRKVVKSEGVAVKPKQNRAACARVKMQMEKLLAQIEEEKKAKIANKLSRTDYEPGPDYDTILDTPQDEDDFSDMEIPEEDRRKLTPAEINQVYKNGKLIAQGEDLERLYRRIYRLVCEICDRRYRTLSMLFSHYKEVHKGSGFVRCCKHKFYTRYSVNRHLLKHVRPKSVECPICKKVISRKKSLNVHMQSHLPMDQRRYQCGQCKLGFTHMAQLSHHVARRHSDLTNADLFQCNICLKKFTTKPVHDYHKKSVHREATDLCQECGKTFKTPASLNAHIKRLHTEGGDPRMKCPHCDSVCKKSNLKIHIKTIHEHVKKPCPHCQELVFPKSMRSHIRHKHEAGLMYPCNYCGKRFKDEKYLKFHVVQHTGIPNFVCEYCPKTFASSGNYHTHRKRVHKRELDRIAQEKLLNNESVPVYNPDEEKGRRRGQVQCDPQLLQSIRYSNPTIFLESQQAHEQAQLESQQQDVETMLIGDQHHRMPHY